MKKLYTLKSWYSLPNAAARLSLTLGEEVSEADILQLTIEGHLPLSWNMRYISALPVAPYCTIHDWDKTNRLNVLFGMPKKQPAARIVESEGFVKLSDTVEMLEGHYILDYASCGALKDWVQSLITGTGGGLITLEGFLVRDRQGNYWKVMERFPHNPKDYISGSMLESFYHVDNYYPSGAFPSEADLGITQYDLEAFEKEINATPTEEKINAPLSSRERDTLLKIIIGMAIAGYRYTPDAVKNSAVKEIADDLAKLGIAISPDTIRGKLKEAQKFLPLQAAKNLKY